MGDHYLYSLAYGASDGETHQWPNHWQTDHHWSWGCTFWKSGQKLNNRNSVTGRLLVDERQCKCSLTIRRDRRRGPTLSLSWLTDDSAFILLTKRSKPGNLARTLKWIVCHHQREKEGHLEHSRVNNDFAPLHICCKNCAFPKKSHMIWLDQNDRHSLHEIVSF